MANKLLSELLKGTYSGATAYTVGDIVDYSGSSYACKANTTGNLPTNTTYWALLAEKGATGATGPQGPAGNDGATGPQGPAGTGDVNKVGTPVNNQIGVWTGDGTIEGDAALTFDTTTDTLSTVVISASGNITGANLSGTNTGDQDISGKLNISDIDDTPVNGEVSAPISSNWAFDHAALASSDTVVGHIEVATTAETNTGTDATRAVSPDGLSQSYAGTKSVSIQVTDGTTDVATGDGKAYLTIPEALNGMNLIRAQATVVTAGTTNATTVMIHNKTDAQDMLSGAISIASAGTVGTVGTVNASFDDVATNDVLRIDVDSVSTTAPKGLMVVLEFRLP